MAKNRTNKNCGGCFHLYDGACLCDIKCEWRDKCVDKKGPGRPPGPTKKPEELKRNFTTKLSPEWFTFLDEMKKQGKSKAWCINKGLRLLKKHLST